VTCPTGCARGDGDEASAIHWPSSLHNRDLVVRQQLADADELWIVHARSGTGEPDAEAARVRASLEAGLRAGASVAVRVDDNEPRLLGTIAEVVCWSAEFESETTVSPRARWWRRAVRLIASEPRADLSPRGRWVVAAAGAVPFVMLMQPLGYGAVVIAIAIAGTAVSAALTTRTGSRMRGIRQAVGLLTAGCVGAALIDPARITSVAASLRFLMPQMLIVLVVLQGFECVDRRSARVSLACAATITAYGAGVRVDDRLALWLVLACGAIVWAYRQVARPPESERAGARMAGRSRAAGRRLAGQLGGFAMGASAVVAFLALLPVPREPAQLTLPSWLEERREAGDDGGLAAPDGSPLLGGTSGRRGGTGDGTSAGSYAGFSPTMDTALRGELGDEIVLRVKAPSADYWRGQTYVQFDGRTWTVDEREGLEAQGPDHDIRPAEGDASWSGDQFFQTFYVEVDLPNLVFAASSARRVLLDSPLWQRPDGALRAGFVLPAGSAYTVVSERSKPTADALRSAGDVSTLNARHEYLQLPDSTTQRVRDLAQQFALGSPSTYETIVAMHEWLRENVEYDRDAPVPPSGADAVDDFLFESQLGLCEQIASATAIMLRSLGVPARIATGFVPSSRDAVAGVWISRAPDAHAWVEVHFSQYGWVAFDPTASVPLSGEGGLATIGGELFSALSGWVSARIVLILAIVLLITACSTTFRLLRRWQERRRRRALGPPPGSLCRSRSAAWRTAHRDERAAGRHVRDASGSGHRPCPRLVGVLVVVGGRRRGVREGRSRRPGARRRRCRPPARTQRLRGHAAAHIAIVSRIWTTSPSSSRSALRTAAFTGTTYPSSLQNSDVVNSVRPIRTVPGIIPQP